MPQTSPVGAGLLSSGITLKRLLLTYRSAGRGQAAPAGPSNRHRWLALAWHRLLLQVVHRTSPTAWQSNTCSPSDRKGAPGPEVHVPSYPSTHRNRSTPACKSLDRGRSTRVTHSAEQHAFAVRAVHSLHQQPRGCPASCTDCHSWTDFSALPAHSLEGIWRRRSSAELPTACSSLTQPASPLSTPHP